MVKLSDLRKRQEQGDDNWQLSLADMMTLLLCFYVLILSVSRLDPSRFEKVAASMEQAMIPGAEQGKIALPPKQLVKEKNAASVRNKVTKTVLTAEAPPVPKQKTLKELKKELEVKFADIPGSVDLTTRDDSVAISLRGAAFFDSASAELAPAAQPILADIAGTLTDAPYRFTIEGHTDNLPIESWLFPSNWELSSARASRVARFLIDHGIPKEEIKVVGLADTKPMLPNVGENGESLPDNQARNRRVVILISPE